MSVCLTLRTSLPLLLVICLWVSVGLFTIKTLLFSLKSIFEFMIHQGKPQYTWPFSQKMDQSSVHLWRVEFACKFAYLHWMSETEIMLTKQFAKKVLSNSPGLVDFSIGLVNSVLNLPDGQVMFFWGIWITEELWNKFCSSKSFWG